MGGLQTRKQCDLHLKKQYNPKRVQSNGNRGNEKIESLNIKSQPN